MESWETLMGFQEDAEHIIEGVFNLLDKYIEQCSDQQRLPGGLAGVKRLKEQLYAKGVQL